MLKNKTENQCLTQLNLGIHFYNSQLIMFLIHTIQ